MADQTPESFESCAICGRTILRGERMSEYVTTDGERHRVCSLCKVRAEASGWIPAELAGTLRRPEQRRGRGTALRAALGRAAGRMRQPRGEPYEAEPWPELEPDPPPVLQEEPDPPRAEVEPPPAPAPPEREEEPVPVPVPPVERADEPPAAKPPARTRRSTVEGRLRRAIECFNESEQSRVVAGLIRSLGEPHASVRSVSARPSRVAITVAWELSWYRWEVSEDGDGASVREVAKGGEVTELAAEAKRWNATVDADGNLRLARSGKAAAKAKAPG